MRYVEAFASLGYALVAPRSDWTAASETGVCITLWEQELRIRNFLPWIDSKQHGGPLDVWKEKPGNKKRKRHLALAMQRHGGHVDVIIVTGVLGEGYGAAIPWVAADRGGSWKVTAFDPETGHFRAEVQSV